MLFIAIMFMVSKHAPFPQIYENDFDDAEDSTIFTAQPNQAEKERIADEVQRNHGKKLSPAEL